MKINKDLILRKLGNSYCMIATNDLSHKFHGMIRLNETGATLFNLLKEGLSKEEIINKLEKEYQVEKSILTEDIDFLISTLESNGLLDD